MSDRARPGVSWGGWAGTVTWTRPAERSTIDGVDVGW